MKWSNLTVHDTYRGLFTKHLEVQMHVQGTYKPPRVGVGPAETTTKPQVQHASTKSLSSCGSAVQERTKKCPGKKITRITDQNSK